MAPEIYDQKPYDEKVDIWAAGCIVYFFISGEMPYEDGDTDDYLEKSIKLA